MFLDFKDAPDYPSCDPSACVHTYEPVCGSDNKTYVNMCYFKAQTSCNVSEDGGPNQITVAYTGECCNFECTNEYSPICDNFGETHLVSLIELLTYLRTVLEPLCIRQETMLGRENSRQEFDNLFV